MKIELNNLCHDFGDRVVLQSIDYSADIHSLAIIGPSGEGKSTLLRIIGGLLMPTKGEIVVDGKRLIFEEKAMRNYRRSIGFVFQSKGLFEHLTALENVTLPLIYTYGMDKKSAEEIANGLFKRFDLSKEKGKYPVQLSGGQQQRIAIARAVGIKPKLLLLDEPTSALDPEFTVEVLDMLMELQNEGLSTILVTHEMGFAKNACKEVVFLAEHRIMESGLSSQIFKSPQSTQLKSFLNKVLEWSI